MQTLSKKLTTGCRYFIVGLILSLVSQSAFAQFETADTSGPFFGNEAKGKWLIGLKVGKIDNNAEDIDDADALGLVLGYEFFKPIGIGGTSTVELEYISGDETEALDGFATYEAEMLNLFMTYRSPGTVFFKFKLGLSYSNVEATGLFGFNFPPDNDLGDFNDIPLVDINSQEEVSLAGGIGLGFRIQDYGTIEIEHVSDAGDNDLSLTTISAIARF
ncbi:MAG: porin family protein [Acidiferrobacterales bacterium]|nr:porin family protein [Acidiferrobacterales bacterium]